MKKMTILSIAMSTICLSTYPMLEKVIVEEKYGFEQNDKKERIPFYKKEIRYPKKKAVFLHTLLKMTYFNLFEFESTAKYPNKESIDLRVFYLFAPAKENIKSLNSGKKLEPLSTKGECNTEWLEKDNKIRIHLEQMFKERTNLGAIKKLCKKITKEEIINMQESKCIIS